MTTPAFISPLPRPASRGALAGFNDQLRSELRKLRSVRSTLWTLLGAVTSNVAIGALVSVFLVSRLSAAQQQGADPVRLSLIGLHLSQIALGTLGVLTVTSEYGTGLIRATLAATPRAARSWPPRRSSSRASAWPSGSCPAWPRTWSSTLPCLPTPAAP
ncbi:hypothetical protein ACIOC2_33210 [Streptomyces sp. NPDC088337]|uniref:hypothetical protein n=1 Tax=unclassified Streptomyces TaxID=2593676 RepID=UPI0037FB3BC9